MAFLQCPSWNVSSVSDEDKMIDVWVKFGFKLGCTQTSDWAVFMWSFVFHNPLNLRIGQDDLNHFMIFMEKPHTLKKCSHMLRCRNCSKIEAKGAHLRQCF